MGLQHGLRLKHVCFLNVSYHYLLYATVFLSLAFLTIFVYMDDRFCPLRSPPLTAVAQEVIVIVVCC